MFLYLPNDILQYILNIYINYSQNKNQLLYLINDKNFKFKRKMHIKIDIKYYENTHKIKFHKKYIDNQLHGLQRFWYKNGKRKYIKNYKNGSKRNYQLHWYPINQYHQILLINDFKYKDYGFYPNGKLAYNDVYYTKYVENNFDDDESDSEFERDFDE